MIPKGHQNEQYTRPNKSVARRNPQTKTADADSMAGTNWKNGSDSTNDGISSAGNASASENRTRTHSMTTPRSMRRARPNQRRASEDIGFAPFRGEETDVSGKIIQIRWRVLDGFDGDYGIRRKDRAHEARDV